MLNSKADKYASSNPSFQEGRSGYYFPDVVVDSFINQAHTALRTDQAQLAEFALRKSPLIHEPRFTLQQSKELVLAAMHDFDPTLGKKAQEIFDAGFDEAAENNFIEASNEPITQNGSRWRLRVVDPGQSHIMCSVPAEAPPSEFGAANPNPHSVIQYEFDGTINGVIYMAHELGHSLADDYLREAGYKNSDSPRHMDETQAYFGQHILYDYIRRHPELETRYPGIVEATEHAFTQEMTHNLFQIPVSLSTLEAQRSMQKGNEVTVENTLQEWLGPDWQKHELTRYATATLEKMNAPGNRQKVIDALGEEANRLHERPMGILTALGLLKHLQSPDMDPNIRRRTMEALFGAEGPKTINAVLEIAGIDQMNVAVPANAELTVAFNASTPKTDIKDFAHAAISAAIAPLQHHNKPAMRPSGTEEITTYETV